MTTATSQDPPRIGFISLGCPKALVDSERILTQLRTEGYAVSPTYDDADLVVVNTCGFIDSAVAESLDAIGEAMAENGRVVVTGCLGVKPELIEAEHPGVLAITGPQQYESVMSAVRAHVAPPDHNPFVDLLPPQGIKLTPRHFAYLKVSEGCNHSCTFCIIPSMRGKLVSRPAGDVLSEAERLVAAGVRELLVVSQDTSAYGVDVRYRTGFWGGKPVRTRMLDLADALGSLGVWVRMHYVYPYPHVDELIPLMADGRVLPYLDIPFQHASPTVLKAMKRPAAAENTLQRIRKWRDICPDLAIRSTFIVGFPGETEQDFETLLQFVEDAELDRVGCFTYSPVEGARANALPNAVPEDVKADRLDRFMACAAAVSERRLAAKVGRELTVLVDSIEEDRVIARSYADAPDIDGCVYIDPHETLSVGEFAQVTVTAADSYDLWAEVRAPD
ncbi:MAG: 30S ribosomal protein S12 methylthiotransferase RimO [Pseudomonadota bacterium]